MAKASAERALVLVVQNFEDSVLDAKRVGIVVAKLVTFDLRRPAREVLTVEQGNPLAAGNLRFLGAGAAAEHRQRGGSQGGVNQKVAAIHGGFPERDELGTGVDG
jgi:hypothetical protein